MIILFFSISYCTNLILYIYVPHYQNNMLKTVEWAFNTLKSA